MREDHVHSTELDLAFELLMLSRDRSPLESHLSHLFATLHRVAPYTIAASCIPIGPDTVFMADVKEAVSTDALDDLECRACETVRRTGNIARMVFGEELVADTHAIVPDVVETFTVRAGSDSVEIEMMLAHGGKPRFDPDTHRHAQLVCQQTAMVASLFFAGHGADALRAEIERISSLNERIMLIAHDISNSLQSVTGYSEMLLLKDELDTERKRMLELILNGAHGIRNQLREIQAARHAPKKPVA